MLKKKVLTKFMKYYPEIFWQPRLKVTLPREFNDPFDSQLHLCRQSLYKLSNEFSYFNIKPKYISYLIKRLESIHILSLSSKYAISPTSSNMWGLYADSGNGLAFEFDYDEVYKRFSQKPLKNFLENLATNSCSINDLTPEILDYIKANLMAEKYSNIRIINSDREALLATDYNALLKSSRMMDSLEHKLLKSGFLATVPFFGEHLYEVNYKNEAIESKCLIDVFRNYIGKIISKESQLDLVSQFMTVKNHFWEHEEEYRILSVDYASQIINEADKIAEKRNYQKAIKHLDKVNNDMHFVDFSNKPKYNIISAIYYNGSTIENGFVPKIFLPFPTKIYLGWEFDISSKQGKQALDYIMSFCEKYSILLFKLEKCIDYDNNEFKYKCLYNLNPW